MNKNVALYIRVSTSDQYLKGHSVPEQTERLSKFCESQGWNVLKVYTDAGYTGTNMRRPALQQLISDIKRIDKVVVYKLDRLSRSQRDTLTLIEDIFIPNNTDLVSMNESFDTATPFGRAMIGVLAVFAQLEREQIKERMQMGKDARAKDGKWMGGKAAPFGYDYKNDELTVNDYEAMIVNEIFKVFLQGSSCYAIANLMNSRGYRPRASASFRDRTVRRILESRIYIGYIRYKDQWYRGSHDPIIGIDDFEKAQELLRKRSASRLAGINPGKVSSYLGGLLICAHCGAHYSKNGTISYTRKSGEKVKMPLYTCNSRYNHGNLHIVHDINCKNKSWKVEKLDELVFEQIKFLAMDPDIAEDPAPKSDGRIQILKNEIDKLDQQLLRLMDLYQIGSIPFDLISEKVSALDAQKKNLEKELLRIKDAESLKISRSDGIMLARSFDDVLKNGNFDEIRKVITSLIDYIEIDGEDISIHWAF
jgi:site-specific DNA recombinase